MQLNAAEWAAHVDWQAVHDIDVQPRVRLILGPPLELQARLSVGAERAIEVWQTNRKDQHQHTLVSEGMRQLCTQSDLGTNELQGVRHSKRARTFSVSTPSALRRRRSEHCPWGDPCRLYGVNPAITCG